MFMKVSRFVFASLVLVPLSLQTLLASVERIATESHVINLSNALIDDNMTIGVYEFTGHTERDDAWYNLKDGSSIREDVSGLSPAQGWRSGRLVERIKGNSDNVVLFRYFPSTRYLGVFVSPHESRWILILKPALDEKRNLKESAPYTVDEIRDITSLKFDTLFELYDGPNGALCVRWPSEFRRYSRPVGTPVYSDELPDDIWEIASAMREHGLDRNVLVDLTPRTEVGGEVIRTLVEMIDEKSEEE
jgi:hypothetical protein